jgi:hypothetical protein
MAADLGLYLNSINTTKKNVMRDLEADPSVVTQYPGFIINRLLSYHQDCVLIVNAINKLPQLDPQMQYEFLLHGLSKKKRFSKLYKEKLPESIDLIKLYYHCSTAKAMEVIDLHSPEDLEAIQAQLSEGGLMSKRKK